MKLMYVCVYSAYKYSAYKYAQWVKVYTYIGFWILKGVDSIIYHINDVVIIQKEKKR